MFLFHFSILMIFLVQIEMQKMTDSKTTGVMLENQGDAAIQEDNEDMTCTICLDPFKVGEELSFSRHLKCHHCFHSHW